MKRTLTAIGLAISSLTLLLLALGPAIALADGFEGRLVQKGYYKVELPTGMLADNFSAQHTALLRAQKEAAACRCEVRLHQPAFAISVKLPLPPAPVEPSPEEPEPEPEEPPPPPVAEYRAVFSYELNADGTLKDPQPLSGATITQPEFFLAAEVANAPEGAINYYCCKLRAGPSRDAAQLGEHFGSSKPQKPPYQWLVKLPDRVDGYRELYLDHYVESKFLTNRFVFFQTKFEPPTQKVTWELPARRVNGDALGVEELDYVEVAVVRGDEVVESVKVAVPATEHVFELPRGEYQASAWAVDTAGLTSEPSAPVDFAL